MKNKHYRNTTSKTIGPVADLEKHLPSEWWKSLFDALYLKTDGDVFENEQNTIQDVELILHALQIKPEHTILDLCCGQGRHALELYRRGYHHVTGIDRSRYLIRLAKKRAKHLNALIKFSEGDARKIRLPESSQDHVLLLGNSFGYFEDKEDDLTVLKSIQHVLKSQGKIFMDIVNGEWQRDNVLPQSWEWIDENQFVCRERTLSKDGSRLISREVVVHSEIGVLADQFYAERLYTPKKIQEILELLGFSDIQIIGNIAALSTRDKDLGMMANRMLIHATAPKKVKKQSKLPPKKSILVMLGDPRLTDSVKRNGQFNDEDFETIQKLKDNLSKLPQYQFHYFDHHRKLIDFLSTHKTDLVLNLCDEGYKNRADYELHIPALLDIFNIPYTGGNPACLGICYNKSLVRAVAQSLDIPVPSETYYNPMDQSATIPSILPAIIKPNFGDSSIGITQEAVVHNSVQFMNYLKKLKLKLPKTPLLIQEFLPGEEYTVGLVGNPGNFTVLPILTVDYSDLSSDLAPILGYESKWLPNSPYWQKIQYKKASLDSETERQLIDYSTALFERFDCKDYARFDFRADTAGIIKLLEINPNPGWCWDGKLNLMASFAGLSYHELLEKIITAAIDRLNLQVTHTHHEIVESV